ncbi:DUF1175 family protein [candidate division WOR-3 bacterium]|nr:DUF1175 family protein [candidate division WOR-3 bacterium]
MAFFLFLVFLGSGSNQPVDKDADGFPDEAELQSDADRRNFRRWFTTIALSRYLEPSDEVKDCADLVRYAYREALREHDEDWYREFGKLLDRSIPEITAFHYPDVPYIGTDIFRIADGAYQSTDRAEGKLGNFADVPHLRRFHTVELGREKAGVKAGDLLFFAPQGRESHVMIYVVVEGEPYLLYHTGPGEEDEGEMRLIKYETLMRIADETWRPDPANPAFVGFYRFKTID